MSEVFIHINDFGEIINKAQLRKAFQLKKGRYRVRIEPFKKRSLNQNDFYWLLMADYLQPALFDAGYEDILTREDAHRFFAEMYLKRYYINKKTGEGHEYTASSTVLSTVEWEAYREQLNRWASEYLGIVLPDPRQQLDLPYEPSYIAEKDHQLNAIIISK